jgi:hypothetical protein
MKKDICFIMMPFGDPYDDYYEEIYKPAVENTGHYAKRADSLFRPSPIIKDIWEYINKSNMLIADITGLNPNVMYELGLAHAISKPVIIISDSLENIPFDLRAVRILIYNTKKPNWSENLKEKIIKSIAEVEESPTDAIVPAYLNIKPNSQETDQVNAELLEIKQLILRNINKSSKNNKALSPAELIEARVDARRLYYNDGWDILDIKNYLMETYGINILLADNIFHNAISKIP